MNLQKTIACILFVLFIQLSFAQLSYQKKGLASYYADKFVGRRTSSGEIFSQSKMTCAHRTLPLGTKLRITNTGNNKSVEVVINDRGPYNKTRVIDLTKAAAKKLDFLTLGETEVTIEVISCEVKPENRFVTTDTLQPFYKIDIAGQSLKGFSVKVASYLSEEKMMEVVKELKAKTGQEIFVQTVWRRNHFMYRIFAGKFSQRSDAESLNETIRQLYPDCYITELTATN